MLTDVEVALLKQQMVPAEDIENIVSYDPKEQTVVFTDGTQRTLCECWTR